MVGLQRVAVIDVGMHEWGVGLRELTALLDALDSGARESPVDSLCGILDGLDWALACNGGGAEQAGLTGNLLTEHGDVDVGFVWSKRWLFCVCGCLADCKLG
jgi:hypothetical protein